MMKEQEIKKPNKTFFILKTLVLLVLLSIILAAAVGYLVDSETGNTAMIYVDGTIALSSSGAFSDSASAYDIVRFIKEADKDSKIKAIIVSINSPGGSPVASDEIGRALKESNKTTVAVIREVGASGGYWVASAADHVIANRMSQTGSIGVYGSYLAFSGLLERYNITYEQINAGKYKDMASPFKELTPEERKVLEDLMNEIQEDFIDEIAVNRNMSDSEVREIATGMIFTGKTAKDLGLVDELGGIEEAKKYISAQLNITPEIREYKKEATFLDLISGIVSRQSFSMGQGIGQSIVSAPVSGSRVSV
jgi:protease-4